MYCERCKTELEEGDIFCPKCGAKVDCQKKVAGLSTNAIIAIAVVCAVLVIVMGTVGALLIKHKKDSDEENNKTVVMEETSEDETDSDYEFEDETTEKKTTKKTTKKKKKTTTQTTRKTKPKKTTTKSSNHSKSDLRDIADDKIGDVVRFEYHDYDKNGTSEAFFVSATEDEYGYCETPWEVYFIDSKGNITLMHKETKLSCYFDTVKYLEASDSHGFFSNDKGGYGSGWWTDVYSVKNGKPKKLSTDGFQGFNKKNNGTFYTTQNEFLDGGGHEYPEYELIYDSSACEFSIGSRL